jgi:hypothetical protein
VRWRYLQNHMNVTGPLISCILFIVLLVVLLFVNHSHGVTVASIVED